MHSTFHNFDALFETYAHCSKQAVRSSPPFRFVIHTASPYHFNVVDPVKDLLDPAIKGTVNLLTAIYRYAPTVERVVFTSSSATILNPKAHAKVYDETIFGATNWTEALNPVTAYRASKVSHQTLLSTCWSIP